ncbi:MAG: hypothetical protein GY862_15150 [Gammaproteobacteria bacterium]|nr:hypothetical protein [Gammaproteobacteria bacterium]
MTRRLMDGGKKIAQIQVNDHGFAAVLRGVLTMEQHWRKPWAAEYKPGRVRFHLDTLDTV